MKYIFFLFALCSCDFTYRMLFMEDGLVEEIEEQLIKEYTGIDVDLSPSSKEGMLYDTKRKK